MIEHELLGVDLRSHQRLDVEVDGCRPQRELAVGAEQPPAVLEDLPTDRQSADGDRGEDSEGDRPDAIT